MEGSGQGPGAAGSAAAGAPGTGPSAAQPGPGRSTDAAASDAPEGSRRPSDGAEPKQQLAEQEQTEQEPPPECRICLFPGGPQDRLVAPCKCAGTVKWAHMACLQQWSRERASLRCEICKTRYRDDLLPQLEPLVAAVQMRQRWQVQVEPATADLEEAEGPEPPRCSPRTFWLRFLVVVSALALLLYLLLYLGTKAGDEAWASTLLRIFAFALPALLLLKVACVVGRFAARRRQLDREERQEQLGRWEREAEAGARVGAGAGANEAPAGAPVGEEGRSRWWRWRQQEAGREARGGLRSGQAAVAAAAEAAAAGAAAAEAATAEAAGGGVAAAQAWQRRWAPWWRRREQDAQQQQQQQPQGGPQHPELTEAAPEVPGVV